MEVELQQWLEGYIQRVFPVRSFAKTITKTKRNEF